MNDVGTEAATDPLCVSNPVTGELIATTDIDGLIALVADCKRMRESLQLAAQAATVHLLHITEGMGITTKTRRVRGRTHRARLEMPGVSYEQSILKESWFAWPQFRDELLRIERVGVKAREFGKARNEAGHADYMAFVRMIGKAEREPTGLPTVTIESDGGDESERPSGDEPYLESQEGGAF